MRRWSFIAAPSVRHRYIAFVISAENSEMFSRHDVIQTIKKQCQTRFQTDCKTYGFFLTRFENNKGILRCYHTEKERAVTFLQSIQKIKKTPVRIETIATSGTIKSLIKKHLNGDQLKNTRYLLTS